MTAEMFLDLARSLDFDLAQPVGKLRRTVTSSAWRNSCARLASEPFARRLPSMARRGCPLIWPAHINAEIDGDGYLIALNNVSCESVAEITEGLVPELKQRGRVRRGPTQTLAR